MPVICMVKLTQNMLFFTPGTLLPIGSDGNINFSSPAGVVSFTDQTFIARVTEKVLTEKPNHL